MKNFNARKDKEGNYQLIQQHLYNVSEFASAFSKLPKTAELAALLHDIGKYSFAFQDYLRNEKHKDKTVIHSQQGVFFLEKLLNKNNYYKLLREVISLVIVGHHNRLADMVSPDGEHLFLDKYDDERKNALWFKEIAEKASKSLPKFNDTLCALFENSARELMDFIHSLKQSYKQKQSFHFALGLLTKYIYSCLIDADRLDAYLFDIKEEYKPEFVDWDKLIKLFENKLITLPSYTQIDRIRSRISNKCKEAADREPGIYHLSVPTGGGKTLSSLRFALHHAKKYNKSRIIYIIPFLSIIDQTAKTIRDIFDMKGQPSIVLEHHSDVAEPPDEEKAIRAKLAASRWDSPIIITTLVQFLETIMSAKGTKLRKLHNMENAVIIFDEIQSLPIHSVYLFNEIVTFLSKMLGCTILLCTATQPLLDKTEMQNLILSPNPNLISEVSSDFATLKRTNIAIEDKKNLKELADFVLEKMAINQNCLVIVNTKKVAQQLYNKINLHSNPYKIFHLSTSMCSAHRIDALEELAALLKKNQKVLCVSTQLIEAGVDISFACVIRSMAGLDSILQAAGRCNRHGEIDQPQNVYVIPLIDEHLDKLVDIKKGKEITERIIRECPNVDYADNNILEKYYEYYFFERKNVMGFITSDGLSLYSLLSDNGSGVGNFENRTGQPYLHALRQAFSTAGQSYQVINRDTETVVVYYKDAEMLLELFKKTYSIKEKLAILKKLQKYSVAIFKKDGKDQFANELSSRITLFDEEFGIKVLEKDYYSPAIGVNSEIEEKILVV